MARRSDLVLSALMLGLTLTLLGSSGVARAQEKKPDGVGAVSSPSVAKAQPLPEPPADLAKLLAVYDKDPEPQKDVKRLYASSLYYLLERNLERFVLCFHKDFEIHQGADFMKMPPSELKGRVEKLWQEVPKSTLKVEELVQLEGARAYTREQAKKWIGDWKKQPSEIAKVMEDGDMLVIAPTNKKALGSKATDFDAEVFYVFRKQDGVWKIALGE